MRNLTRVLLTLTFAVAAVQPAASLTIDSFEVGNINVVDDSTTVGTTSGEQSGLATTDVAGGVRLVRVGGSPAGTGAATATALLTTVPVVDDGVALALVAVPDGTGTFEFIYDGIANGVPDLFLGNLNANLVGSPTLDIAITTASVTANVTVSLYSASAGGQQTLALVNGVLSFPMNGFGAVDLSDVNAISVLIGGINNGEAPIITNISTVVPEPATGLLISLGLVGLAIYRRRA
jgi:PEP-CTERM motif-containing protein